MGSDAAPHIRHLPKRDVRQGFFERGEFENVVAHLPAYLQDFARFALMVAWRKAQITSLTWVDVDRAAHVIVARAENVKNGRAHKIVLEGELANIIERRWDARQYETAEDGMALAPYVFISMVGPWEISGRRGPLLAHRLDWSRPSSIAPVSP
jgi:integrase